MARKYFSGQSAWARFTRQSPPLPDYFFDQRILYWKPSIERDKWEAPSVEDRYLSKAVHLLSNSHPGCFRVWDEVKQDVVVAADIKPLSIPPGVDSLLQGQQNEPGRRGEVKDDVLKSQCKILVDGAAQVPGLGADLPALRLQRATSHSEEPIAESRQHPEAAIGQTSVRSGARTHSGHHHCSFRVPPGPRIWSFIVT